MIGTFNALSNDRLPGHRTIIGAYLEGDFCEVPAIGGRADVTRGFRDYCMQHGAHASRHTFEAGVAFGLQLAQRGNNG